MLALCLVLSSCASPAPELPKSFGVRCKDACFNASYSDGELVVSFSEPSTVSGISITVTEDGAVAELYGVSYELSQFAVNKPLLLFDALRAAEEAKPTLLKKEGNISIYIYLLDGKEYLVYYNTEQNMAVGLEADGLYFEITGETK